MSDGVPKSRVTLTYDTKQPEGRRKKRELPFRLLILGDVGGEKVKRDKNGKHVEENQKPVLVPLGERRVRQLNGRNLGEVMRGLRIKVSDVKLDGTDSRKVNLLVDSMDAFSPDNVLRLITGQKEQKVGDGGQGKTDEELSKLWGEELENLQLGDKVSKECWGRRQAIVEFLRAYQNSRTLRTALKRFSLEPAKDSAERESRRKDLETLKKALESASSSGAQKSQSGGTPAAGKGEEQP